jgi:hypothetical protein
LTIRRAMTCRVSQLLGLLLAAAAAGDGQTSPRATLRTGREPSPHWKSDACNACHEVDGGRKLPIARDAVDKVCAKCHDGRKAAAEFHPVDRTMDRNRFTKPADWPLLDNRLTCLTCHDVKSACNETPRRIVASRLMLRENRAASGKSQPFCLNCHQESSYQKLNPHQMLEAQTGHVLRERCLVCHDKPMEPTALARTGDALLKADEATLCRTCHVQHKDAMQQGHIGLPISPDMLARMALRETLGLSSQVGPKLLAQARTAGLKPTRTPPHADGTIVCSTCHNPHESGVFPRESALSYLSMRRLKDGQLFSPVQGRFWCRHCHPF